MRQTIPIRRTLLAAALSAALMSPAARADERSSLEQLRETTLGLIEALVEQGILTRDKADRLISEAQRKAQAKVAEGQAAPAAAPAEGTVRVPYVPEIVKNEIREQLKQEVLAQAKNERWAQPNAVPEWLDRIKLEGDVRVRYQYDSLSDQNTPPLGYVFPEGVPQPGLGLAGAATRAADLADARAPFATNTTEQRERLRVRARLGVLAKVSDSWSASLRLATGNTQDRVSTNQTLGQNFNKYQFLVDRAYLRYAPFESLSVSGGRIPNPWFGTDLMWDDDLNFEGVAATWKPMLTDSFSPYVTAGYFPVKERNPPAARSRALAGAQLGFQWTLNPRNSLKFGAAVYDFSRFEGHPEDDASFDSILQLPISPTYGNSVYEAGLRQRGNTLFRTNSRLDNSSSNLWGLASKFRPLNVTASYDWASFDPVHVVLTADWVRNLDFDANKIAARIGLRLADAKDTGYQFKVTIGMPRIREARDWQFFASYRYLGSDATLDAFTDSDFGFGGTNQKGYIVGLSYGLDRNVGLNLRWLSADSISSPTLAPGGRFSSDILQADVNLNF